MIFHKQLKVKCCPCLPLELSKKHSAWAGCSDLEVEYPTPQNIASFYPREGYILFEWKLKQYQAMPELQKAVGFGPCIHI